VLALKTPDDLEAAKSMVERHGTPSPMAQAPAWRMVVSPAKGRFRRSAAGPGAELHPGELIGTVVSLRDEQDVAAPHGGTIVEWLAEDGDPVGPGQPLIRLHPQGVGV
jgi:[acyl-carrier-protein] S-malonyltransferase